MRQGVNDQVASPPAIEQPACNNLFDLGFSCPKLNQDHFKQSILCAKTIKNNETKAVFDNNILGCV